jgi:hypothetical protein
VQASEAAVNRARWGYPTKTIRPEYSLEMTEEIRALRNYRHALVHKGAPCLCPDEAQQMLERLLNLSDTVCRSTSPDTGVTVDESGMDEYMLTNPTCVPYDSWERSLYRVCPVLNLTVKDVQESAKKFAYDVFVTQHPGVCKLTYDVLVSGDSFACKVAALVTARASECKLSLKKKTTVSDQKCMVEFNSLVQKITCDLDFSVFAQLRRCGLSVDLIGKLVECNVGISYSSELACPAITYKGETIALTCDLDMSPILEKWELPS